MPITLIDIAKMNAADGTVGLIDETTLACPEVRLAHARTIKGTQYKTLVRTGLPAVAFRKANEGVTIDKSAYENRLIECFIFNARWEADKAVCQGSEDGPEAVLALEAGGQMEATFQHCASQFYYGTANDANGFPGLIAAYDATNMVVDAGGTTANTGSSVWAVKFGPTHVQWVWGGDGATLDPSDVTEERVTDGSGNPYTAYCQEILTHVGLQVANINSIGRIKKLTADSGKGLTDDLIYSMFSKFPAGIKPDMLLMSRRSLEQLRSSRTATNATGAPAPTPTEVENVPIQVTDAIVDTEALTL